MKNYVAPNFICFIFLFLCLNSLPVFAMRQKEVETFDQEQVDKFDKEVGVDIETLQKPSCKNNKIVPKINTKFEEVPDEMITDQIFPFMDDPKDFAHFTATSKMARRLGESCIVIFDIDKLKNEIPFLDRVKNVFSSKDEGKMRFFRYFDKSFLALKNDMRAMLKKHGFCAFLFIKNDKERQLFLFEMKNLVEKDPESFWIEGLDHALGNNVLSDLGDPKKFNESRKCLYRIVESKDFCCEVSKAIFECFYGIAGTVFVFSFCDIDSGEIFYKRSPKDAFLILISSPLKGLLGLFMSFFAAHAPVHKFCQRFMELKEPKKETKDYRFV